MIKTTYLQKQFRIRLLYIKIKVILMFINLYIVFLEIL